MEAKPKETWKDVTMYQVKLATDKLANWKSPGPDQVQNFWLKYLTDLQPTITRVCNVVTKDPAQEPSWLMVVRKTLIHNKGPTDVAKKYRPITCLTAIFNLMILLLTDRIYKHVTANLFSLSNKKDVEDKHADASIISY